ncbi:PQQ-like beta-propeller repeat protein [Amycolatopsis sp. H6(2020)]|nr:PQQ-like beta-propeller repeat protein [Amycolatopsis sp. H6(2020)]
MSAAVSCAAVPATPPASAAAPAAQLPKAPPGTTSWTPWPSALHDARHSGASTTEGPANGNLRWRRKLEGGVTPGPVVGADGTIYVASNGGVLHALNPANGTDRWTYDSGRTAGGDDLSTSPLVLPSGVVLFAAGSRITMLSPTGKPLWSKEFDGRVTSPVTADGERVYLGTSSGTVTALDVAAPDRTRVAWRTDAGAVSYASVVTDGHGRVYTTADSALVAIDDRGDFAAVAWRSDPHDDITEVSPGLAADGTALLGTNGRDEWAYRPDGTVRWQAPRIITYSSPAVTATGLSYVADHGGRVHVFDIRTGSETASYGPVGTNDLLPVSAAFALDAGRAAHAPVGALGARPGRGERNGVMPDWRRATGATGSS